MTNFMDACKDVLNNKAEYTNESIGIREESGCIEFFSIFDKEAYDCQSMDLDDIESDWTKVKTKSLEFEPESERPKGYISKTKVKEAIKEYADDLIDELELNDD